MSAASERQRSAPKGTMKRVLNSRWALLAAATLAIAIAASRAGLGADMDERAFVRGLAAIVNDALSRYIVAHNDVFKASAKRLVPIPGVFEAIDFKAHVETLTGVEGTLTEAGVTTASAMEGSGDVMVRRFLGHLQKYEAALLEAVRQLRQISERLYRKSQDPKAYKWSTYQKDLHAYEDAVKHYSKMGVELNAAYERIR
jgi:hypothetical protein